MSKRLIQAILISGIVAPSALAGGIVTIDLNSPQDGAVVPAGAVVAWNITTTVSQGDNAGLALIAVDLVQDAANPEMFDLPSGGLVAPAMQGFSRPAGFSNARPDGSSAFTGTQVGSPGALNLAEIGGAQNNTGLPGFGVGEDADVEAGIGQSGPQLVVVGSFAIPATPGTYRFNLENGIANTFDTVNPAPQASPVSAATVAFGDDEFEISVCLAGDANGDLALALDDVNALVELLLGAVSPSEYQLCAVDLNHDGLLNGDDISLFLDELL